MKAVIFTGGKQYIVEPTKVVKIDKLEGNVGDEVTFDKVLLTAEDGKVNIGTPFLSTTIVGKITEQGRNQKIRVVKYKRKVRYTKEHGHRQHFTKVEIVGVK
jgi:large subunit ribosomal protein L21